MYLETKICVLALEYQKKFQFACISAVTNIINLPYYVLNLKVKLGHTIAQVGSWYLLSQRPTLILAQSMWECAEINLFILRMPQICIPSLISFTLLYNLTNEQISK